MTTKRAALKAHVKTKKLKTKHGKEKHSKEIAKSTNHTITKRWK